jgi:hypothetical protein
MRATNEFTRGITCILLGVVVGITLNKVIGVASHLDYQETPKGNEIFLEFKPIVFQGITKNEQEQIEKFVNTLEGYKYQKDADGLLGMFSPPESKEEQDTLDSILGKDGAQGNTKPLSRLFSTQGYNHSVGGYYVRSIKKDGNSIVVTVDELRSFYTGLSEDFVGYSAKVVNMVIVLEKSDDGYQIVKYYHTSSDDKFGSKYEGFVAY